MSTGKTYSTKYLLDSNNNRGAAGQVLSTTSTGIDWVDANTVPGTGLWLANGNDIYNSNSGNVGIGEDNPTSLLHLYKASGDPMINIQAVSAGDPGITFTSINNRTGNIFYSDGTTNAKLTYDHADTSFKLYAHNTSVADFVLNETTSYFPTQNVGIGTTDPDEKLVLYKPISYASDSAVYSAYAVNSTAVDNNKVFKWRTGITGNQLGHNLTFSTLARTESSYVERMRIDSAGNVGIGDTPSFKLDVNVTSSRARFKATTGNADIELSSIAGHDWLIRSLSDDSFAIYDEDAATERMRIDSSGLVGINVTSPQTRLQTNLGITGAYLGYLNGTTSTFDMSANVAVVHNSPAIGNGTGAGLVLANNDKSDGAPSPIIAFSAKSASNSYNHTYAAIYGVRTATGADTNWTKGDIVLATSESTGPIERMRITSAGELQVTGNGVIKNEHSSANYSYWQQTGSDARLFTQYAQPLYFGTNASTKMTILSGGNVGIGVTGPVAKLHVEGTGDLVRLVSTNAGSAGAQMDMLQFSASPADDDVMGLINMGGYYSGTNSAYFSSIRTIATDISARKGALSFFTRSESDFTEKMRIDSVGNVGIGTTSPGNILHVSSAGSDTYIRVGNNAGYDAGIYFNTSTDWTIGTDTSNSNAFTIGNGSSVGASPKIVIQTGGNVGIGVTSPNQKLHVNDGGVRVEKNATGLGGFITIGNATETAGNYSAYFFGNTPSDTNYFKGGIAYETLSATFGRGDMHFLQNDSSDATNATISDSVMTILNGGNVGIGTTSPSNKLAVCDSNGTGLEIAPNDTSEQVVVLSYDRGQTAYRRINFNALDYIFRTSATERMRITSAGTLLLRSGAFPTNQDSPFLYRIGGGSLAIGSATETGSGAYVALYTNSLERMRITSAGNVGIGTTSPNAPLQFSNAITTRKVVLYEMANNNNQFYGFGVEAARLVYSTANTGDDHVFYAGASSTSRNELIRIDGSNGDIKLSPSSRIILDDTPAASTASGSGTIVKWSVSDTTTAGTLYTVKTNGLWTPVDADNEATSIGMLAIALGSNATDGMLLQGFFYKASHGFTIGLPLYISNTAGAFTTTRPTGTNDYVRIIGYATSTNYIYFDPDKTWVQVA